MSEWISEIFASCMHSNYLWNWVFCFRFEDKPYELALWAINTPTEYVAPRLHALSLLVICRKYRRQNVHRIVWTVKKVLVGTKKHPCSMLSSHWNCFEFDMVWKTIYCLYRKVPWEIWSPHEVSEPRNSESILVSYLERLDPNRKYTSCLITWSDQSVCAFLAFGPQDRVHNQVYLDYQRISKSLSRLMKLRVLRNYITYVKQL